MVVSPSHQEKMVALHSFLKEMIIGQEELLTQVLCSFLAGGHILLTGAPGLAKTTLVKVLSQGLHVSFRRIQFTPDLLPSDILGGDLLHMDLETGKRSFEFAKGPIFTHMLLADEINRASARTQSALLEAMQERKVTVSGHSHELPWPFMVLATQNPLESEGTFPLPEAQLDRFLFHSLMSYPSEEHELKILEAYEASSLANYSSYQPILSETDILELLKACQKTQVPKEILIAINHLVRKTRHGLIPKDYESVLFYGSGPRGALSLIDGARALAFLEGRTVVQWKDVKKMAHPALRHRIKLNPFAKREGKSAENLISLLIEGIEKEHRLYG